VKSVWSKRGYGQHVIPNPYVQSYVKTCEACARGKPTQHLPYGELSPLPIPSGPWNSVSCDFITDLPEPNAFNLILVFIDCFTKMVHFVPCTKTTDAPAFAQMFLDNIIRAHGIPDFVVSNCGSIFTSHFWKALTEMLGL
jgi:hypothetical protein